MRGLLQHTSIIFLFFSCAVQSAAPIPEAGEVLQNASHAIKHLNYQARVTFEHSGVMEVADITHVIADERVIERVRYLNGPDRGITKSRPISCEGVGAKLFGGQFIHDAVGGVSALAKSYHMSVLGSERVAGRDSWVVHLQPKDQYRHNFILAVDMENFLPTRVLTLSKARKVLERTHVVAIEEPLSESKVAYFSLVPTLSENCDKVADAEQQIEQQAVQQGESASGHKTRPKWLPPGFVLASSESTQNEGFVETYTDGLAAFTVVVKTLAGENTRPMSTRHTQGATVVVSRLLENSRPVVQVSVLGEIPVDTATKILGSVQLP